MHNVGRSSDPGGARSDVDDALAWDLNGRIAHHWLSIDGRTVSTIDLIGDGLTLLAGPNEPQWSTARPPVAFSAPISHHTLDRATADALELAPDGALLTRPDGREIRRWSTFEELDELHERDGTTRPTSGR